MYLQLYFLDYHTSPAFTDETKSELGKKKYFWSSLNQLKKYSRIAPLLEKLNLVLSSFSK